MTVRRLSALVVLLVLAGCGGGDPEGEGPTASEDSATVDTAAPFAVRGGVTLSYGGWDPIGQLGLGGDCRGTGGYDDIVEGAQVVVTDDAGRTVALGELDHGVIMDRGGVLSLCRFDFGVRDVPGDLPFYGVTIANRNTLEHTRAELDEELELTLD